jgi:hypothetical protein
MLEWTGGPLLLECRRSSISSCCVLRLAAQTLQQAARSHQPCSFRTDNTTVPVSSPTMHSAIFTGSPLGPLRVATTLLSSTCVIWTSNIDIDL